MGAFFAQAQQESPAGVVQSALVSQRKKKEHRQKELNKLKCDCTGVN